RLPSRRATILPRGEFPRPPHADIRKRRAPPCQHLAGFPPARPRCRDKPHVADAMSQPGVALLLLRAAGRRSSDAKVLLARPPSPPSHAAHAVSAAPNRATKSCRRFGDGNTRK